MIENLRIRDIDAVLSEGRIYSGKGWRTVEISIFAFWVFGLALFAISIGIHFALPDKDFLSTGDVGLFIVVGIVVIGLIAFCAVLSKRFRARRKRVATYLQDAVFLKARASMMGKVEAPELGWLSVGLLVEFYYLDKRMLKQSTHKGQPQYLVGYQKYINQVVSIAYSPKYDEVMLIKPKSLKKKHIYQKQEEQEAGERHD